MWFLESALCGRIVQGACTSVLKLVGNRLREKVPRRLPAAGALVAVPVWPCKEHRGLEERFWVCLGDGQVRQGVLVLEPVNPDPGHPRHHVESQCWPKVLNQLRLAAASKSVIQTDTVPNRCVHTWWQPRCYDSSLSRVAYSSVNMSCGGCHHCLRLCALAHGQLASSIFTTGNNPHTRHAVPQEKQAGR